MPQYPALMPYSSRSRICSSSTTRRSSTRPRRPAADGQRLEEGGDGVWIDAKGKPAKYEILGTWLSNIGPVVAAQLKRNGLDVAWTQPPDASDRFTKADYQLSIYGHGGSIQDPYNTLNLYTASNLAVPGLHQSNFPRWTNAEYDKAVTDVYLTSMKDKDKLKELFHKAMEIWLPELPDIQLNQFYHNIAFNTDRWTGWPTDDDSYVNEASWHLTWQLVLNKLQPAG